MTPGLFTSDPADRHEADNLWLVTVVALRTMLTACIVSPSFANLRLLLQLIRAAHHARARWHAVHTKCYLGDMR